ncbi:MAG: exonuclease SbcC, partial [Bacteroidales bacterium]|nr:exonuclease SbcC [Bacteroidales bacterium]
IEVCQKNIKQREELNRQLTQAEEEFLKWEKLNKSIGDSTGGKFRKIAQSYVLENLINSANYHLKSLTDRYKLRVKPGSFVIELEDAYNGFTLRPATTISGGESFLISLSLALALSDIGQGLSLDILFIDEGFGTLSKEVLQTAIETLGVLHKTLKKNVGIISHVEELQERIPVQIKVEQQGNNSSSKVSVITT